MCHSTPDHDGEDSHEDDIAEAIEEFREGDAPSEGEVREAFLS